MVTKIEPAHPIKAQGKQSKLTQFTTTVKLVGESEACAALTKTTSLQMLSKATKTVSSEANSIADSKLVRFKA